MGTDILESEALIPPADEFYDFGLNNTSRLCQEGMCYFGSAYDSNRVM